MLATISLLIVSGIATPIHMPSEISNTHIAFIDSLFNSMTKGEGGLKHTCYQVFHTNEPTSFIEQDQCQKAKKEIAFTKKQYPVAQSFVQKYKRKQLNNTTDHIQYLAASSEFINDCKSEKNIRAAKTMRYWGTDEVGDWHYKDLAKMGSNDYKAILSACKPGSWVYKNQANSKNALSNVSTEIASANFVPSCIAVDNSNSWTRNQQSTNVRTLNDLSNKKATLEIIGSQLTSTSDSFSDIDSTLLRSKQTEIKKSSAFCQTSIAIGTKALKSQELDKARASAAKKEAERQYQRAKEAQRRAAAAEAARQQKIQDANEGVVLD